MDECHVIQLSSKAQIDLLRPHVAAGADNATNLPGSIQDPVLRKWLKGNGIDDKKLETSTMAARDTMTSLDAGMIDGFFIPHPSKAIVDMGGRGKYAVTSDRMRPDHACCSSILANGRLIRDRPDLVKKIIKTHAKATNYINHHSQPPGALGCVVCIRGFQPELRRKGPDRGGLFEVSFQGGFV
jgi:NitT/TauT family transport system substrate-binding protein